MCEAREGPSRQEVPVTFFRLEVQATEPTESAAVLLELPIMRFYPAAYEAWTLILLGILLGCADSEPPPPPVAEPRPTQVDLGGVPELGDYISGLDNGRLDVAGPEGWILGSRSKGYVVRFLRSDQEQYPMILVTGKDRPGPREVSADNVDDFAQRIKAEESVGGPVEPIVVGRFVGVTYRKRGKEPRSVNRILERLLMVTVVAGREYGVELRAREGRLDEAKESLFAVVDGIRFSEMPAEASASSDDSADGVDDKSKKKPEKGLDPDEKGLHDLLN